MDVASDGDPSNSFTISAGGSLTEGYVRPFQREPLIKRRSERTKRSYRVQSDELVPPSGAPD